MVESWEHEEVVARLGDRSGIPVMVAVHSRKLGPAAGGIRLRRYPTWQDGLADALRLSKGMTYKNAVAGLRFGGGKGLVAVPPAVTLTPELRAEVLADLGDLIESLDGSYIGGPDVGTTTEDMLAMRDRTRHVLCVPESHGGTGSSSGPTAAGVLAALRAGTRAVFGTPSCAGLRVVVIGMGSVGSLVAQGLSAAGAAVMVSDVDTSRAYGFPWVDVPDAMSTAADVIVPAAVGGVLGPTTDVHAPLVVGPANNQLTHDSVADTLAARGTVWIPDFVASAGGVVYTLTREAESLSHASAMARVATIEETVDTLLAAASTNGTTPLAEAIALAARRLAAPLVTHAS